MIPGRKRPIAVEDLLALKRAERPAPEFWADFDRQLRAKQLAALVGRRPWWQQVSFATLFSGLRRYHLPLGAATVAAITLVSFRVGQPVNSVVSAPEPVVDAALAAAPAPESRASGSLEPVAGPAASVVAVATREEPAEVAVLPPSEPPALRLASFVPPLGALAEEGTDFGASANSRGADMALGSRVGADTVVYRTLLSSSNRFEARVAPANKMTVEPLHQITPPSERRGSRILTAMVSMSSVESAMRTTERAASRLSEEQLYDQIHRFGARGAGVNVKF